MAHSCPHSHSTVHGSTQQTLDELDFYRGIWSAVLYNDVEALEKHIQNGHIEDRDNSGYTALHYAARNGNLDTFKRLIQAGANINAQTNGGSTAFHRAAMQGHDHIIAYILTTRGFDANLIDCDGQTALHRAAQNGHHSTVKLILNAGHTQLKRVKDTHARTPYDLVTGGNNDALRQDLLDEST